MAQKATSRQKTERAKRRYWVSNERGEKDSFDCSSLHQVTKLLKNEISHILTEDGQVCGGFVLESTKKRTVLQSNGHFLLKNGKAIYIEEWNEMDEY